MKKSTGLKAGIGIVIIAVVVLTLSFVLSEVYERKIKGKRKIRLKARALSFLRARES